jgi:predicted nucleic acid-binding protein
MRPNSEIIISDTSCLILLSKIGQLDLLIRLSKNVFITSVVKREYGKQLPSWVQIKDPKDIHYQRILEIDLDAGEASAISLSLETHNSILLIDELKGRKIADKLQLRYSGTFGLILKAKQQGIISSVLPIIEKIRKTNFRFSATLLNAIIREAGEEE